MRMRDAGGGGSGGERGLVWLLGVGGGGMDRLWFGRWFSSGFGSCEDAVSFVLWIFESALSIYFRFEIRFGYRMDEACKCFFDGGDGSKVLDDGMIQC